MNGILLIDKPSDWTSSDVVAKLRGVLHERRIGHSGTLDPMATGLLVVFVGRATRAVEFAESHSKRYIAGLRLGITTDTQDITGTVLQTNYNIPNKEAIEAALEKFKGDISQIPPMYSAIKVNGKKLYEIARKGGEVERKARRINISALDIIGMDGEDYLLDVSCSKGTYIRTLCNDIGAELSCGGCMSSLRRIAAGNFSLNNTYTLSQVQEEADKGEVEKLLIPVDNLFSDYSEFKVSFTMEKKLRNGISVKTELADGKYRVYSQSGEFLLLGQVEAGMLKTIKSFFEV